MKNAKLTLGAALIVLAGYASTATAQQMIDLTIGASHPLGLPWIGMMQQYIQPEVNKRLAEQGNKYQIRWREGYGGTLYKANATLSSVSDGIVDIGWVFSTLEGSKLPLAQVGNYTPGTTGNSVVVMEVVNDLNDRMPALQREWAKNNVVFLSSTAMDTLHLFTSFPVTQMEDLKGKKLGGAGTVGIVISGAGGTAIDSAAPGMYNDISTGLMQGALTLTSVALVTKIYEVAPYVTRVDMGSFAAGAIAMNKDRWDKMPPEVQGVIKAVSRDYSKRFGEATNQRYESWFKAMEAADKKVKVTVMSAVERERWIKALPNIASDWAKTNEAKGVPARQVLTSYMDSLRQRGIKPIRDWDK